MLESNNKIRQIQDAHLGAMAAMLDRAHAAESPDDISIIFAEATRITEAAIAGLIEQGVDIDVSGSAWAFSVAKKSLLGGPL